MAKVKVDVDIEEEPLDNSTETDYLDIDDGSFDSGDSRHLIPKTYVDTAEDSTDTAYFKDISGAVAYRVVLPAENSPPEQNLSASANPTPQTLYLISDPGQMFACPPGKKPIRRDPLQKNVFTKKRDDKRRATHNEVERRRRDKINTWIGKLAALIPNSGLPDSTSKGGILAKACDHITELTEKKHSVENEKKELLNELYNLKVQLNELKKENISLKSQMSRKRTQPGGS